MNRTCLLTTATVISNVIEKIYCTVIRVLRILYRLLLINVFSEFLSCPEIMDLIFFLNCVISKGYNPAIETIIIIAGTWNRNVE